MFCRQIILIILLSYFSTCLVARSEVFNRQQYKKTIAIDLDGVLDEYYGKYDKNSIPKIKEGAKDFVIELSKDYKLVLFTTRNSKTAKKWLVDNNIDKYFIEITNKKPLASIYLDDRAINFDGDYNKTLDEIKNFKVYWKY